jgi:hypothetical protein
LLPPPPARPIAERNLTSPPPQRHRTLLMAAAVAVVVVAVVAAWMAMNRGSDASHPIDTMATQSATQPAQPPAPAPNRVGNEASREPAALPAKSEPSAPATPTAPEVKPAEKNSAPTPASAPPSVPAARALDSPATAPAADASAKKLFVGSPRNAGLRYGIVQLRGDDSEVEVPPDTIFHSGDRVRFAFEPNTDGYLYLVQEGSSGKWNLLFPNPQINGGANAVQRGTRVTIPSQGWFKFEGAAGMEKAFVFLSREPLESLPGFKEPVTKMESVGQSVVEELQRRVKSRDLVFEKDSSGGRRQSAFVVNRDELGKFVSAAIQLVHQ